jgi:hypothetical protein
METPDTAENLLERLTAALKSGAVVTLSGEGVLFPYSGAVAPMSAEIEFDSVWDKGERDVSRAAAFTAPQVLEMVLSAYEFEQGQR